ncbi:MAG: hypothetical protein QMD86_01475, partial [Patescibacteria group bacterium]|nr:hypothetical protein [Patescibacteria group bacterium]
QDFNLPSATTVCIPDCGFTANPKELVLPQEKTTVSWDCDGADSCELSGDVLPADQSKMGNVNPLKGSVNVSLNKPTTFFLACKNQDGQLFKTTSVDFLKPRWREITPL